ncbi:MAG: hypothetical protein SFU84_06800 [Gemmatimonadales bacterium]|nr:hypothetical protein [Gemmatimonadales bacterium]
MIRVAIMALAALLVLAFLYLTLVLNWTYSEGERSGTILKFSKKGWLCKTWEGELAMSMVAGGAVPGDNAGISTNVWYFTVRDDQVAQQVSQANATSAANGRKVVVYYREHRGIPTSCFGDTPYFVDSVRVEK